MINVLNFRLSLWYSSGVFALVVIILTSVYVIVLDGVSPLIAALFSSGITLLVPYNDGNGDCDYNGLSVALNIKPGVCGLDGYGFGAYSLFI